VHFLLSPLTLSLAAPDFFFPAFLYFPLYALDEMRGRTEIRVETQNTLASVTFWNQGDVAVLTVDRATRKESILDDRKLTAEDEIESLLNRKRTAMTAWKSV
jgi:hypothetical protein